MTASEPAQVREFAARLAQLQQQREQATAAMAAAAGSASSPDGLITVTITAGGELQDLHLAAAVQAGPELAGQILRTARDAQQRALGAAAGSVAAIVGEDSAAVAVLQRQAGTLREGLETQTPATRPEFGEVPRGN